MTRSPRVTGTAALATVLTATALSTVVDGVLWFAEVLVVAGVVAGVGALAGRTLRHPVLVVLAQVIAVGMVITWLYALPETVYGLLPGPDAVARLADLAADGGRITREYAAPVPALPGVRLLVTGGLALVAVAVDLVAVTLRRPAAAGLPLLAVYGVPVALAPDGLGWYWFVLAAAGFLLLVASDSGDRVARWGRVLSGEGGQSAPMAAAGRRVGALALGTAVVVPVLVPGLSQGLLDRYGNGLGTGGGEGTISVVNPILSLRDDLTARADIEVLTYSTDQARPEPLRIVTVDAFDGDTWGPSLTEVPRSQVAAEGLPPAPGLDPAVDVASRRTTISITSLRQGWLPVPYPPTIVDVEQAWLYEEDTLNVVGDGVRTEPGLNYTVRHLEVSPTPEQLAAAPPPPAEVVETWTALPDGVPAEVIQTARDVAGDADPFTQATALQTFFRSSGGFRYTTDAPQENGSTAIADFLVRRNGYCVQFASAMAVMARSLGIPARVAVGFLPGTQQPDGSYSVSLRDAHSWPELYFEGVGWMRFEPTPATRTGALPRWATPLPDAPDPGAPAPVAAPVAGQVPESAASTNEGPTDSGGGFDLGAALAVVPWRVVSGVVAVLLVLASPALAGLVVRRRRWRRARDPVARAEAAWLSLSERLGDVGQAWPTSLTPRQAQVQTGDGLDAEARAALHRLARAVERARYAQVPVQEPELRRDVVRVLKGVERRSPSIHLWRAAVLPRSGTEHLRSGLVEVGLLLDRWERAAAGRVREVVRGVARRLSARRGDAASAAPGAP